jgi:hypothetical protein
MSQGGVIGQIVIGQRMYENRQARRFEYRENSLQVGLQEMHLELRVRMGAHFAIAHLAHE